MMPSIVFALAATLLVAGCKNENVQTYRLAKDSDSGGAAASAPTPPAMQANEEKPSGVDPMQSMRNQTDGLAMPSDTVRKGVAWKTPAGWTEQPASQMRVGSFSVPGRDGQTCEASIVPIGGSAGSDLDNVNRWRGQINLPPIGEGELPKFLKRVRAGSRQVAFVDMVSAEPLINQKYKKRLMTAYFEEAGHIWFVKLTGEDESASRAKNDFMNLVGSIKINP